MTQWFYRRNDFIRSHMKTTKDWKHVQCMSPAELVLSTHTTINEVERIAAPGHIVRFSLKELNLPPLSHNDVWSWNEATLVENKWVIEVRRLIMHRNYTHDNRSWRTAQ